jgi:hypothetical protein
VAVYVDLDSIGPILVHHKEGKNPKSLKFRDVYLP